METNTKEYLRLREIWDTASKSYKFVRDIDNSEEAYFLRRMMVETMGYYSTEDRVYCPMTNMCTNRTLPGVLNDYGRYEVEADDEHYDAQYVRDRFHTMFDCVSRRFMFPLVHDNDLYSRFGMGPIWGEILYQIDSAVAATAKTETGGTTMATTNTTT